MLNVGTFWSRDGGKTMVNFAGGDSHDLWIDPDDTNHIVHANDSGTAVSLQRAGGAAHVDGARLSDRAVLPRDLDGARAVSRLRRAAGRQHRVRAEQHEPRRRRARRAVAADAAARRSCTAPAARSPATSRPIRSNPDIFYAGGNNGSFLTRLDRRTGNVREVNPYPREFSGERRARRRALAVDVSDRLLARRSEACSTPRRSTCGRRRTAATTGTGSAAISRATIRRRWAPRAARSRTT